ncbi:Beta-hexosaminidase [Sparassis crispa]|uniref:Beta-hexosaminidase n=1 Tax=Sparassis crispa TaxID=139825 RepID=A0A401GY41_9APHY|nr:Beta-hexosaminidase [Sparassis crispa]GBE87136.1 Beta-hexosaminidase [Sparassis crispa]
MEFAYVQPMTDLTEDIRREIGQHFVFGFHGHDVNDDIRILICDYFLGNVILMKRNVQSIVQVRALVRKLQLLAKEAGHKRPLMIGIDQENGLVSAFSLSFTDDAGTQFPGAMALAASGSPELAERVSHASGRELRLAGIHWAYSPVADINSDPRNPVIGVRSYGDDPNEVALYVQAVSRGLISAKIAPSAKHFPGHGNTHIDSHLNLPRIMTCQKDLAATELVPFQALVDSGIPSIMTGHMALPLITDDDTPCSLSRQITTGLLREEMGFKGVIVTDCLEMEAVASKYGAEGGAVMSLQAGADIVMICHQYSRHMGALEAAYTAVREGKLSIDALRVSGVRINALKDEFAGAWDDVFSSGLEPDELSRLKQENILLAQHAYARSVAVIRDPVGTLPLSTNGHAVLFTPRMESINLAVDDAEGKLRDSQRRLRNTAGPSYQAFAASISQRVLVPVKHIVYAPDEEISDSIKESLRAATSVIFATRNGLDHGEWQIGVVRRVVETVDSSKLALVSTCAPYDLLAMQGVNAPCLATFEFTVPALRAAVAVIFGETTAVGTVPVK